MFGKYYLQLLLNQEGTLLGSLLFSFQHLSHGLYPLHAQHIACEFKFTAWDDSKDTG